VTARRGKGFFAAHVPFACYVAGAHARALAERRPPRPAAAELRARGGRKPLGGRAQSNV